MASASYQCVDAPCRAFSDEDDTALSIGRPAIHPKRNIFLPEISELLRSCSRSPYIDSTDNNIFIVDRNLVREEGRRCTPKVDASKDAVGPVGRRLSAFAESLGLRFELIAVVVPDLKDDMFEVDEDETLGMFSHLLMNNLIVSPDKLENLMRVKCRLTPRVVTVIDNLNNQ